MFDLKVSADILRPQVLEMSKKVRYRGPDCSGIYFSDKAILAHERLAIVDLQSGREPLHNKNCEGSDTSECRRFLRDVRSKLCTEKGTNRE